MALSTEVFGYPLEPAARVALETVINTLPDLKAVRRIRFVLHDDRAFRVHLSVLEDLGSADR